MTNDTLCTCEHNRGQHSMRGNCLFYDVAKDKYTCECTHFVEAKPSVVIYTTGEQSTVELQKPETR